MRAFILIALLVAVAAHVWFSRKLHRPSNETILTRLAVNRLEAEEFAGISLRYDFLDAVLEGTVYSPEKKLTLAKQAASVIPAGRLVNRIVVEKKDIPFRISASSDSGGWRIAGSVSNESLRDALAQGWTASGTLGNEIKINPRVVDPDWLPLLPELMGQFFRIAGEPATFEVDQQKVRLSGMVKHPALKDEIIAAVQGAGFEINDQISVAPKELSRLVAASKDRQMVLRGLVPDEASRESFVAAARRAGHTPSSEVTVESHSTTPLWLQSGAELLADLFAEGSPGEVEFTEGQIRLKMPVQSFEERDFWISRAKGLDPAAKITDEFFFPSTSRPFEFGLNKEGKKLFIAGWLPSSDSKSALLGAIEKKFKGFQIENQVLAAPNVTSPSWLGQLPKYIESLPAVEKITQIVFNEKGLELPEETPREEAFDFQKMALSVFGKSFPGLDPEVVNPPPPPSTVAEAMPPTKDANPTPLVAPAQSKSNPTLLPTVVTSEFPSRNPAPLFDESYPCNLFLKLKGNDLVISGNIKDASVKNSVEKAATAAIPGLRIKDELNVDDRVIPPTWKDGFAEIVKEMLQHRPVLAELEIDFGRLRLKQLMPNEVARQSVISKTPPLLAERGRRFIDQLTLYNEPLPRVPEPPKTTATLPPGSEGTRFLVYFASASHRLDPVAQRVIREAAESIIRSSSRSVILTGYTDASGTPEINRQLSEKRASQVRESLISLGVKSSLIKIGPRGEVRNDRQKPSSPEDRRVEILLK